MTAPTIHGNRRAVTASDLVVAAADDLLKIKFEDGLTWAQVGEVLGKSDDQAAKYADGSAVMDFPTFMRGKIAWNGRFSGTVDRLVEDAKRQTTCDFGKLKTLLLLVSSVTDAVEDGTIDQKEVAAMRPDLEAAREAIDELLNKDAVPLRGVG